MSGIGVAVALSIATLASVRRPSREFGIPFCILRIDFTHTHIQFKECGLFGCLFFSNLRLRCSHCDKFPRVLRGKVVPSSCTVDVL